MHLAQLQAAAQATSYQRVGGRLTTYDEDANRGRPSSMYRAWQCPKTVAIPDGGAGQAAVLGDSDEIDCQSRTTTDEEDVEFRRRPTNMRRGGGEINLGGGIAGIRLPNLTGVRTAEVEAETVVVEAGERRCGADPAGRSIVEAMGVRRSRRDSRGKEARR
jgi:hypothetical protein